MECAYLDENSFPTALLIDTSSIGAAETRLQFVHVEELLNCRYGHDVRSRHSFLELAPQIRM
jgi:hypothetical protein